MEEDRTISTIKLISSKHEAGNVMTFVFETGGLSWIAEQYQKYILPQANDQVFYTDGPKSIFYYPHIRYFHATALL